AVEGAELPADLAEVRGFAEGVVQQQFEAVAHRLAHGTHQRVVPGADSAESGVDGAVGGGEALRVPGQDDRSGLCAGLVIDVVGAGGGRFGEVGIDEDGQVQGTGPDVSERDGGRADLLFEGQLRFVRDGRNEVRVEAV